MAGNILLGHQVHAIFERGNQHDISCGVDPHELVFADGTVHIMHYGPANRPEPAIDAPHSLFHGVSSGAVMLNAFPRRRGYLHQHHIIGVQCTGFQQFLKRQ